MDLLPLGLAWLIYFFLHSLTASLALKRLVSRRWPKLMPAYRFAFNLFALITLLPPLWLDYRWQGPLLWSWQGMWAWIANGAALMALALFIWSLRYYNSGDFLGLRQLSERSQDVADLESFKISPLHRYVRHPWYSLGLVMLWSREMNAAWLLSSVLLTLYLIAGSRLEERKLVELYGEAYRLYRQKVPGLVPIPGKYLSSNEGRRLVAMAADSK